MQEYSVLVDDVLRMAEEAGDITMRYFRQGGVVDYKDDQSPVTEADIASSRHIEQALGKLTPHIPVISEESDYRPENQETFWLVDPLDGTRAFVSGVPEFTVNIGLVHQQQAVFGVLYVPASKVGYAGGIGVPAIKQEADGTRQLIQTHLPGKDNWTVIKSHAHASPKLEAYLEKFPVGEMKGASSALKFGIIAEGGADLYPRLGPTMEWDTAAGQAIVEAAGGAMQTLDGEEFWYGKAGYRNPGFIVFAKNPA